MIFETDNPKESLLKRGYRMFGLNEYQFVRELNGCRFHAILSYSDDNTIRIHKDIRSNKSKVEELKYKNHITVQKNGSIKKEIKRIKNSSFDNKLDEIKRRFKNYILKTIK